MKRSAPRRVALLVTIIGKEDAKALTETVNEIVPAVHFSGIGYGTASSRYTAYFGFQEIEKRVLFSLIPESEGKNILAAIHRRLKLYLLGKGIAFTMPLSSVSSLVSGAVLAADKTEETGKRKGKKNMHELVIAVVSQKFTDVALDAARAAGATGATVFHTRSVDSERFEQNLGTSLPADTNTLFIMTSSEFKARIMEAIRDAAGLKTDGAAVLFSMPVNDLVGMGRFGETAADESEKS